MSRSLSSAALSAIFAQETNEQVFFLVEIDHADWGSPLRVVNNNEDVTSNGDTYSAFPVDIQMPHENFDKPTKATLRVCNVDRLMIAELRALSSAPSVTLSIVLGSTPDTVEAGPFAFQLSDYNYNSLEISGSLAYEDILNEPIPAKTFTPADFPGLFE